jgi:hypothetical protein
VIDCPIGETPALIHRSVRALLETTLARIEEGAIYRAPGGEIVIDEGLWRAIGGRLNPDVDYWVSGATDAVASIGLEKHLQGLEGAKIRKVWRRAFDFGVGLFAEGLVDEAFEIWRWTRDSGVPTPTAVADQTAWDERIFPVVELITGRQGLSGLSTRSAIEAEARETDRWQRERLLVEQWSLPPPAPRAGLPDERSAPEDLLQWWRYALGCLRPETPGGSAPSPERGVEVLRRLLENRQTDPYTGNIARLLIADHLTRQSNQREAIAYMRPFSDESPFYRYERLALISLAGLLATGQLRSPNVNPATARTVVEAFRAIMEGKLTARRRGSA